jgi:Cys-tRNA(Pro)/Cys-tRNA(Cys) deacylase
MPRPAESAAAALGVTYRVITHGPVNSVAEAAVAQGVEVRDLVKTLVVRRGEGDFLFVLVPGDRVISWPKLRALLGVSRIAMPDAATAKEATGYDRGTITPFGSAKPWPVIADSRIEGRTISLGAGERGVGLQVPASEAVSALEGTFADVTEAA